MCSIHLHTYPYFGNSVKETICYHRFGSANQIDSDGKRRPPAYQRLAAWFERRPFLAIVWLDFLSISNFVAIGITNRTHYVHTFSNGDKSAFPGVVWLFGLVDSLSSI